VYIADNLVFSKTESQRWRPGRHAARFRPDSEEAGG
jgi:hypothetical protein